MKEIATTSSKKNDVKTDNSVLQANKAESFQSRHSSADRVLFLQRTIGNQAVQRMVRSGALQAKLKIGQPGDVYEQEADQVAEQVMRMPEFGVQRQPIEEGEEEQIQAKPITEQITPLVQRQVEEEEEEEELLQTKGLHSQSHEIKPDLTTRIQSMKGGGHPLPKSTRSFFEPRFRQDFSQVRVHTSTKAEETAKSLNAKAFTLGRDIAFGSMQYAPESTEGKQLLAHELAHTIQQRSNTLSFTRQTASSSELIIDLDDSLEQDADRVSARAIYGKMGSGPNISAIPKTALQRKPNDPEPSGDEPLDPFVTGWTSVPAGFLVAQAADKLAIVPLRDTVYVPDPATARRFDPRLPKTPGNAPVFGVPSIGAGGTRVVPAGTKSAVIMDSGAGQGASGMYLSQFAGALRSVNVKASAKLYILPIHAHADHVDQIVELIRAYRIPPENILIPRGQHRIASMQKVMKALTTGAVNDPILTALGYGPSWKPRALRDRGSGPEVIRLGHNAPNGVKIELVGLRSKIETAQRTGKGVDLASYLARITHPDGTITVVLGDLRGADLIIFRNAMELERPGSWGEFFNNAKRLSGFSHHMGRLAAGDARGMMLLAETTILKTGSLKIIEQTNLGQSGSMRRDTLELAARIGFTVLIGEQPRTQSPTSGVVATGTTVAARGPDAVVRPTIPSQLTGGLQRIIELDLAERTILDWRPVFDEMGKKDKVNELLRNISESRTQLRTSISAATVAAIAVRTGRTSTSSVNYTSGPTGAAYTAALGSIPSTTPAETAITPKGFAELQKLRELPESDVPLRVALYRARHHGEYSAKAFRYMLSSLSPGSVRSLTTGPRGGLSGKAFQRVRAQWFTQSTFMPLPHGGSTAGFSRGGVVGAKSVAGGLLLLELFQKVGVPLWEKEKRDQVVAKKRDIYAFARRIAFWAQMGARPSVVGVKDPFFSWSPSRTRDFDSVMEGLHKGSWDAVVIESPGLSNADVMIITAFLGQNIRNYDEYYELFEQSGQDAVRSRGSPWGEATWEIRVGHYDTTWVNEVEERWEKHDLLTEAMQALVPAWIANTEEHLDRFGRRETLSDADVERLGTFSHASEWAPGPPLYQARLKKPVESLKVRKMTTKTGPHPYKPYVEHTVTWNSPPRFFVHNDSGKYATVSGADFNTYASIRPLWTERREHGIPYDTVSRIANENATCLIAPDLLERIPEPPKPTPVPTPSTPFWIEQRIYFPFQDKAPRSDANYDFSIALDKAARILRDNSTVRFRVVGHTDNIGDLRTNEALALARAEAVKALLVARGIAANRLMAEGAGMSAPIATNATSEGRARNRRVEFRLVPP